MDCRNLALGLFMAIAIPGSAMADFSGPLSSGSFEVTMNMGPIAQTLNRRVADNSPTNQSPYTTRAGSLVYNISRARTRVNLQNFVNKTRANDPAGATQMEQLFASTDIIDQINGAMRSVGLSADNAADAYALWWVSAWKASRGDDSTASSASYQAVSEQAAHALSQSSDFANANDAQKQEMAEAMLVQAALIDASIETYAGDRAMMAKLSSAVKQGAAASGLDLDKMTLTEDGFVPAKPRKRSDASDAGAGEEKALAANDAGSAGGEKDEGLSPTQLAMIAAAGGAGLGAVFLLGKVAGKKG
jgi:hypothetical protein